MSILDQIISTAQEALQKQREYNTDEDNQAHEDEGIDQIINLIMLHDDDLEKMEMN